MSLMPILCYSFDPNLAIDADNEAYITLIYI